VSNPHAKEFSEFEILPEYDKIVAVIARNRKFLLEEFGKVNKRGIRITFEIAKKVVGAMLRSNGFSFQDKFWPLLLKFAEKEGTIDYKFMLDVYKERVSKTNTHPKI
jgi:hypothetical protein